MTGPQATDRDLLDRIRQGDREAFARLYARYATQSLLWAAREGAGAEAPDVVQDVWVALFRHPPVLSTSSIGGWLRVAVGHRVRRVARRRQHASLRTSLVPGTATSPSRVVARAEIRTVVVEAHRRGDLTDRDVEQLLGVGVSHRQLAARDGVAVGAVRMRASRALAKLRRLALDVAGL